MNPKIIQILKTGEGSDLIALDDRGNIWRLVETSLQKGKSKIPSLEWEQIKVPLIPFI